MDTLYLRSLISQKSEVDSSGNQIGELHLLSNPEQDVVYTEGIQKIKYSLEQDNTKIVEYTEYTIDAT